MLRTSRFFWAMLIILAAIFFCQLFKNLAYPLLWNDEAETIAFGETILKYGVPKITDGRSYIFPLVSDDPSQTVKEGSNIYIGAGWLQFYWSVPGIILARWSDNLYIKTFFYRLPFVLIGFFAVFLLAIYLSRLITNPLKLYFLSGFFLLADLSLSLILHLREARYYALTVFLTAALLILIIDYFLSDRRVKRYVVWQTFFLVLLFNTFMPLYFVFSAFYFIAGLIFCRRAELMDKQTVTSSRLFYFWLPCLLAAFFIVPTGFYFETWQTSQSVAAFSHFNVGTFFRTLSQALIYFAQYGWLAPVILLTVVVNAISCWAPKNNTKVVLIVSNLLIIFFITGVVSLSFIPWFYERYFISLALVLISVISLDFVYLWSVGAYAAKYFDKKILMFFAAAVFFIFSWPNLAATGQRVWALTHHFKGPLDYIIPYLQERFSNTQNLTIATNYEEHDYLVYLKSRVILGYTEYNKPNEVQEIPDVIIYRKGRTQDPRAYLDFFNRADYEMISFEVADSLVNNIPELTGRLNHYFQTNFTQEPSRQVVIYVQK